MGKKEKILAQLEQHMREVLKDLTSINANLIYDDTFFDEKIVQSTYANLNNNISGLTIFIPSSRSEYKKIMYLVRENVLEREGDEIKLKANAHNELKQLIHNNINPSSMGKGIVRWIANKVLNIIFTIILFFIVFFTFFNFTSSSGNLSLGLIAMLVSWGILAINVKFGLKLPNSPKNDSVFKLYLASLVITTLSYPFSTYGLKGIALIFLILGVMLGIFLNNDGWEALIEAKYGPRADLLKRLSFAVIGAVIGITLSPSGNIIQSFIFGCVGASAIFGFVITSVIRGKFSKYLPRFPTDQEIDADEERKRYEALSGGLPILMMSQVEQKKYSWFLGMLINFTSWIIASIPIGATVIPYYLYLVLKPRSHIE